MAAGVALDRREVVKSIKIEIDVAAPRGRFAVPGIIETVGEPIRNSVTGVERRARIDLPDRFEYWVAEMGSATTKATRAIALPGLENSYAQFAPAPLQQGRGGLAATAGSGLARRARHPCSKRTANPAAPRLPLLRSIA
ncbi:MAG TPA: DUF1326 domain-containing protein [Stellaceae bacterium]|nr:DUF1326 domain-containing protein [Stellaceae bacterium]